MWHSVALRSESLWLAFAKTNGMISVKDPVLLLQKVMYQPLIFILYNQKGFKSRVYIKHIIETSLDADSGKRVL